MFLRDIIAIYRVEIDKLISFVDQQIFPRLGNIGVISRAYGLYDNDPGPLTGSAPSLENRRLESLDIDLQPVDRLTSVDELEYLVEGDSRDHRLDDRISGGLSVAGDLRAARGHSCVGDRVERHDARPVRNRRVQHGLVRAVLA